MGYLSNVTSLYLMSHYIFLSFLNMNKNLQSVSKHRKSNNRTSKSMNFLIHSCTSVVPGKGNFLFFSIKLCQSDTNASSCNSWPEKQIAIKTFHPQEKRLHDKFISHNLWARRSWEQLKGGREISNLREKLFSGVL